MDRLVIEHGGAEDLPEVQGLILACGDGPKWPADAWQRLVDSSSTAGQRCLLLLARDEDGALRGWLAASAVPERSELEYVLVDTARRGGGVAARLMQGWIAWAREHGATELLLEARPSNRAALRLYTRLEFAEQGRRRNYYQAPVEDAVLMGRRV